MSCKKVKIRLHVNNNNNNNNNNKVADQDQAISTNYFKNRILKEEIESKCRLCMQHEETIDHLTSGCPILAKNEYLMRHDKVCMYTFALLNMQSLRL